MLSCRASSLSLSSELVANAQKPDAAPVSEAAAAECVINYATLVPPQWTLIELSSR